MPTRLIVGKVSSSSSGHSGNISWSERGNEHGQPRSHFGVEEVTEIATWLGSSVHDLSEVHRATSGVRGEALDGRQEA